MLPDMKVTATNKPRWSLNMNKLLLAAVAIALFGSPVLAQTRATTQGQGAQAAQPAPRLFVGPGITTGNAVYDCTGKYLGADPDPKIRLELLREGDPTCKD